MPNREGNKNVLILGWVSLFTDLSSQMIYPLIPEFLVTLGVNKAVIGMIEGIAESTAAVFRTVFGKLSDKTKKRKIFIFLGYALSAFSKPLLFFANTWVVVLAVKFSDRLGKAVRTPARDALISTSVDASRRGQAFGVHRAMDRIGALGGSLLALLVLFAFNNNVRLVFLLSGVPALIALGFIFYAKEMSVRVEKSGPETEYNVLKDSSFIIFLIANIVFTMGNSSNAFLLLTARETGLAVVMLPLIWMLYNITCSVSALLLGSLSDKISRKKIIIFSFIYYSLTYFLFALAQNAWQVWLLFAAYGIYYGLSNGIYRAYIADLVEPGQRGTAYGLLNTGIGLALFPASLIMGLIWDNYGSKWAFLTSAVFSLLGFLIMLFESVIKAKREQR